MINTKVTSLLLASHLLIPVTLLAQQAPAKKKPPVYSQTGKNLVANKAEFKHEISGTFDIENFTSKTSGTGTSAESVNLNIHFAVSYGYLVNANLEPLIEVDYLSETLNFGSGDSKSGSRIGFGLGLLVNLPVAHSTTGKRGMNHSTFIPWIGFILSNNNSSEQNGATTVSNTGIKLSIGNRYRLFEDVSINSSIRLSYETSSGKSSSTASGSAEASAANSTSTSTLIEIRLATISLFF
tara:strand:- start:862 stop:1578 length:717 start_codon:yes stop_codon:yes gene_type:complete